MTEKSPTEEEVLGRPLAPFEVARLRRLLDLDPDELDTVIEHYERMMWFRSRMRIGAGVFVSALVLFGLLRDEIIRGATLLFGGGGD